MRARARPQAPSGVLHHTCCLICCPTGLISRSSCRDSQLDDKTIVYEAEGQYAIKKGLTPEAHYSKLGLDVKHKAAAPLLQLPHDHIKYQQRGPNEGPQQQQVQKETQQQGLLLTLEQQRGVSVFMEQQRGAESWQSWQPKRRGSNSSSGSAAPQWAEQQEQQAQEQAQQQQQRQEQAQQQQQLRLSVTGRLGEGQKFGLATSINKELERQMQRTQQPRPQQQKQHPPSKALSLEDFRRERQAEDWQSKMTAGVTKRSALADTLASHRRKCTIELLPWLFCHTPRALIRALTLQCRSFVMSCLRATGAAVWHRDSRSWSNARGRSSELFLVHPAEDTNGAGPELIVRPR